MSAARMPTLHLPLRKEPALNYGDAPIGSRLFHVRDAYNNAICVKVEECEADTVVCACNSHDALVEALRIIDKTCASPFDSPTTAAIVCNIARAALEKVPS